MASPSASHSSSQARPDLEESVTLLIESLKCFTSNNNNNNNLVEQIDKLRLQVEDSFLDSLNNDVTFLYRKSRLSHHFLETSNFVVNNNNNNNSSINFSKILFEISGLGHANNIITKKQPVQNQNQQQRVVMNNTKLFFETLRSQSAILWNALEKLSAENNNINNNFTVLHNQLRCLAVDLMISSLPAPLIVNNNQMMMRDSFLLSTPNLLECCWMMLKTCEIMIDSSTSSSSVCEKQNDQLITMMIYLSSIWKIATASSLFAVSTSATNNNYNIISNLLSTKLSPVAKERLMSIAVDGLNLFVQCSLTKILFVNNHECDSDLLAIIIINHEQFRKNVLQTSIDFLGKSWPSLLPSFVKNCCDLIVETFLNTKIIPNVQQEDESKERIKLIDFTINNLILKFVVSVSSAPVASSTKMICQLLMIKSKYQHKCLKNIEAALETLNEVEIRIKQQQNHQNPRSSNNNNKTFNDDFVPLLCSVFGFRFKMYLEMLLSLVKPNSSISCGVSEDDATSTQQHQQQENDILCQKAFDTLLSLFEIVSTSSSPSTSDVSFVPPLLAQIAKGTEALLSIENCQKILLFNENNHHQGLTLLLRAHEKLWNKNNDNSNSSSKRQLSKVRNMIIVNLCKILNSAESHFPFSAAVLLKVIQYLIKISTTHQKQNLNNNVENADSLLQVVDEEEVTASFQDEIIEQSENSSEEYVALWNCAQNLLLNLSSSSSEENNNHVQKHHEICLSLLRLCTFSAAFCGGVEQKSITLRALARAELLFATLSNCDKNNSAAFDRAQHLLDEAKQISVHSNNNNNNNFSTCSSPHTLLLQFQLHLFRFSISENEQHQQENDLVQDLDDIVSCLTHSPSPKLQADVKEALQIACHLAKQQFSTSKNNATAKHVCRHALKNFVDVQMLEMIKPAAGNNNNNNTHQQQQYVSTIFSILQAWNQTWNDEYSNNSPLSQDLPWLSEVIMKVAKSFSQSILNVTETVMVMEFAKEFQFWIALMLKQLTSVNQSSIVQVDRIYLISVSVSDIMCEILSKLSSSPSVKTEDAVKQDEANNNNANSETTSCSQQQQVRCENRVSTEIDHDNDNDDDDDAAPSQQYQEKQTSNNTCDNTDEIRNLRLSFLQLLLGAATEFLLLSNTNNSAEVSISIHEALNLIQMVKKAISSSQNNNNSIWLHLVSAEISYLIEKNNVLSHENRENTEKEIVQVLDEFYAKTSCQEDNNHVDSQRFLLDRISVDVQLAKIFSSEYFFEAAKKVVQDVFHVASPSSSSSPSLLFETISVICNAFHTGLTSCCPDKTSQLDFAEFASSFFIKMFSDDNNLVEIMSSETDTTDHNNQDCAQATNSKNQENERCNDQFFFFILQSLRAIVCELWNATVFDVNIQDIDRATKVVLCLRRIGVVLKKLQKVGKILVKNSSSSVISSKNQPNNYNNNGFVEVLLAQFQAATQTTLPIFQE